MYTPQIEGQIALWRAKAIDGTLSQEDLKAAVAIMREGRVAASASTATKKKPPTNLNVEDMENELGI